MKRALILILPAVLFATSCKIEQTPAEYFDHRDPFTRARGDAADEVQSRLLAFGQALNRGSATEAREALAPADDAVVIGGAVGDTPQGSDRIAELIQTHAAAGAQMRDLEVRVGPRANVVWFHGALEAPGVGDPQSTLLSGVYVLTEGSWSLMQLHLSGAEHAAPVSP